MAARGRRLPPASARLIAEGTRAATLGWSELVDEQIAGAGSHAPRRAEPVPRRGEGRIRDVGPARAADVHVAQRSIRGAARSGVDGRRVRAVPRVTRPRSDPRTAPAAGDRVRGPIGFTRLTEERGDETAVRTATSLQREADAAAMRHRGRLVKLLGDGAMLRFPEPAVGVGAALDLVETMSGRGALPAHARVHAGPVIERDRDVFGWTVNLASRIADAAQAGEVLASGTVVDAADDPSFGFERLQETSLKGIPEPVLLYRVTRGEAARP